MRNNMLTLWCFGIERRCFAPSYARLARLRTTQVVLLGWLLVGVILPRAAEFVEAKQVFIYSMCVLGHGVILLLSLYWLKVLCGGGLKALLTFKPRPKGANKGGFTFGTDMGRKEKGKAKNGKKTKSN